MEVHRIPDIMDMIKIEVQIKLYKISKLLSSIEEREAIHFIQQA